MLISFLAQLFGLWLLSMAMNKHFRYTFLKPLAPRLEKVLRYMGWGALCLSLFSISLKDPVPLMMVYWVSYLSLNIMFIALLNCLTEIKHKKQK